MKNFLIVNFLIAFGLVIGSMNVVFADTYSGNACQSVWNPSDVNRTANGRIENKRSGRTKMSCSANVNWSVYKPIVASNIKVIDQHFNDNVLCVMRVRSANGGHISSSTRTSSGTNASVQTLTFAKLTNLPSASSFVRCIIPSVYQNQRSSIVSYTMNPSN